MLTLQASNQSNIKAHGESIPFRAHYVDLHQWRPEGTPGRRKAIRELYREVDEPRKYYDTDK
jgi:hypothetical protein